MKPRRLHGLQARRRALAGIGLLAAALLTAPGRAHAQLPVYFDDEVKAAFLFHFGTYVEWPGEADPVATIAVLGSEPIARLLERFLPGKTIGGRPVEVALLGSIEELTDEEILFVNSSENANLEEIAASVDGRPVLLVTDSPGGLRQGATINFRVVQNRVRFEISLAAAEEAGLRLSSRLLQAALRVEPAQ
jgi:hypothetical protein